MREELFCIIIICEMYLFFFIYSLLCAIAVNVIFWNDVIFWMQEKITLYLGVARRGVIRAERVQRVGITAR